MRPSTRIRIALRAALRRRYGYAALRVLRRGLMAALEEHRRRTVGNAPYRSELDDLAAAYWRGLKRIERRFGRPPNFEDPRAAP